MKPHLNCAPVLFGLFVTVMLVSPGHAGERGNMTGMTKAHNVVRSQVGISGLSWSDDLAQYAQQWADHLATRNRCRIKHRPGTGKFARIYGENLYWASPIRNDSGRNERQKIAPEEVVARWVQEKKWYNYQDNTCRLGKSCGHYTQVVWENSNRLGCGMAFCTDDSQLWVCNYDPPGNFIGEKPY